MKSYRKIYSRRFRRQFYKLLVAVLTFAYDKVGRWYISSKAELKSITERPFRLAVMRNQPKFPVINAITSTKQALKALGNPEPSTKDIAEALKRADSVRGDGALPMDPRETKKDHITDAEKALGLHRAMNKGLDEVEVVAKAMVEEVLQTEIAEKTEKLEELKSAE